MCKQQCNTGSTWKINFYLCLSIWKRHLLMPMWMRMWKWTIPWTTNPEIVWRRNLTTETIPFWMRTGLWNPMGNHHCLFAMRTYVDHCRVAAPTSNTISWCPAQSNLSKWRMCKSKIIRLFLLSFLFGSIHSCAYLHLLLCLMICMFGTECKSK